MTEPQTTDAKLDTQTSLLKWILGGVGTGVIGLAVFAGSTFTTFLNRSQSNEDWLKKDLKTSIDNQVANQATMVKLLDRQTIVLEQIRDDQRKFPAVQKPE